MSEKELEMRKTLQLLRRISWIINFEAQFSGQTGSSDKLSNKSRSYKKIDIQFSRCLI